MEKINIDFEVFNTNNPKTILIGDTSTWLYAEEKPSMIYITLPGFTKPKPFSFKKKGLQVFNSNNLGLTELNLNSEQEYIDLPDGVYTVKLESGFEGIEKQRYYLKTDIIDIEMSKYVINNVLEYSRSQQKVIDSITNIRWNLYLAKSFTQNSDISKATIYYNEAVDLFKELNC